MSEEITNIMVSSCSNNTQKQYKSYIDRWNTFCKSNRISNNNICINNVLEFLYHLYKHAVGYSSVNTARSALSLIITSIEGFTVGNHPLVTRFIRGISRLRPPQPRYNCTWDVDLILTLFKSWSDNEDLSLHKLTIKLVSLLAIVTAQRVQTINAIKISNMWFNIDILMIKIPDLLKTSRPGALQPLFRFPPYHVKKLCVRHTIISYLKCTLSYRIHDELLLSVERPYSHVSNQTVSRWLKQGLSLAGIDANVFKAHSYRHASTSKALIKGCSIDIIFSKAGWSDNSKVFATFYNRDVRVDNFMDAVLL
jgi:integrase